MDRIESFIARADRWGPEMAALRAIALDCGLGEALKWGKPCFTWAGANIAILQPFRDECRLMFFKGALLPDPGGLLSSQGENTRAARVVRVTGVEQVAPLEPALRTLIAAAIAVEEAGAKVPMPAKQAPDLPAELVDALDADPGLATAFAGLTPGRQRSWVLHIAGAKQSGTRAARVQKAAPGILAGKGWNKR